MYLMLPSYQSPRPDDNPEIVFDRFAVHFINVADSLLQPYNFADISMS